MTSGSERGDAVSVDVAALERSPDSPWWERALTHPVRSHRVVIDGAAVHYRLWLPDDVTRPLLLFVHGYRGHTHWWDWIAPAFTNHFRVAAVDLSGMGHSEPRARYSIEGFSRDVLGVLTALQAQLATVIAHSYSGVVTLLASALESEEDISHRIGRVIVVDSFVHLPERDGPSPLATMRPYRAYPSFEAIRARYRLVPDQPVRYPALFEHLVRTSVRETANGWRWCFDPNLPSAPGVGAGRDLLQRVQRQVDVVYGEQSAVVDAARAIATVEALPYGRGPVAIADAHHHIMLDQPIALIRVLRTLLPRQHVGTTS